MVSVDDAKTAECPAAGLPVQRVGVNHPLVAGEQLQRRRTTRDSDPTLEAAAALSFTAGDLRIYAISFAKRPPEQAEPRGQRPAGNQVDLRPPGVIHVRAPGEPTEIRPEVERGAADGNPP